MRELDAQLGEMEAKGEDAIIGAKYEMGTSFYKTYALSKNVFSRKGWRANLLGD